MILSGSGGVTEFVFDGTADRSITDPLLLESELARVRTEYNTVRLHESIGYVTPDDEHTGRGEAIRQARRDGLARAHQHRLDYHRHTNTNHAEKTL